MRRQKTAPEQFYKCVSNSKEDMIEKVLRRAFLVTWNNSTISFTFEDAPSL